MLSAEGDAKKGAKSADSDERTANGRDDQPVNGRPANKCDDSDSNASSNAKRNTSPAAAFENVYGEFGVRGLFERERSLSKSF